MASAPHGRPGDPNPLAQRAERAQFGGAEWRALAALAGTLILRLLLFEFESADYRLFLSPWHDSFLTNGRWHGVGAPADQMLSYCYPPLYLYLVSLSTLLPIPKLWAIKLISILADYVAAWYVFRLIRPWVESQTPACAWTGVLLCLPTVVLKSAAWGQCDMLYTTGLTAALYFVLAQRPAAALVAWGVAISFKPQVLFFGPFRAGLLLTDRLPWRGLWIPAAVYGSCAVPSILAGRDALHALIEWGPAAVNPTRLTLGAPNWYQWVPSQDGSLYWIGMSSAPYDADFAPIQNGLLFKYDYNRAVAIYHCPADKSRVQTSAGRTLPRLRTRSYSMNGNLGGGRTRFRTRLSATTPS